MNVYVFSDEKSRFVYKGYMNVLTACERIAFGLSFAEKNEAGDYILLDNIQVSKSVEEDVKNGEYSLTELFENKGSVYLSSDGEIDDFETALDREKSITMLKCTNWPYESERFFK